MQASESQVSTGLGLAIPPVNGVMREGRKEGRKKGIGRIDLHFYHWDLWWLHTGMVLIWNSRDTSIRRPHQVLFLNRFRSSDYQMNGLI